MNWDFILTRFSWLDKHVGIQGTTWNWEYAPSTHNSEIIIEFANETDATLFSLRWAGE